MRASKLPAHFVLSTVSLVILVVCASLPNHARANGLTAEARACGGIGDPACPVGAICIDDPGDTCSPTCGGVDCPGFCAEIPVFGCAGFLGGGCPVGLTCIDDPADACIPDCGSLDCGGICVPAAGSSCAGSLGLVCPTGYDCEDLSGDSCHPQCEGADCSGICVRPGAPCGGIAQIPCPHPDLVCVDDPSDACDPACGGADCGGICIDPLLPLCADAPAPVCGGTCPAGSRCTPPSLPGPCQCQPCDSVVPSSNIDIDWVGHTAMAWPPLPCATTYNSYRLTMPRLSDVDGDAMADHYGFCLQPDLSQPFTTDPTNPRLGFTRFYVITGENLLGEGSMGRNSELTVRPNDTPCP